MKSTSNASLRALASIPFLLGTAIAQSVTGNCNADAHGNNISISVSCGQNGLSRAEAQMLADRYLSLTQKVSSGNRSLTVLLKKLDDLSKEMSSQTRAQTCLPGSLCTQGDNSGGNVVQNNFGAVKPGPGVNVIERDQYSTEIPPPNAGIYIQKHLTPPKGTQAVVEKVTFNLSEDFHQPAFEVACERACHILNFGCVGSCAFTAGPQPGRAADNVQALVLSQPIVISKEERWWFTVVADDYLPMEAPIISTKVY